MVVILRNEKNRNTWAAILPGCLLLVLSFISLNHIFKLVSVPFLSVTVVGLLGWGVILLALIVLSRRFWSNALAVFVLFVSFGAWFGPFLEPPADPLEHLRRTHSFCDTQVDEFPSKNKGFWHYTMSGILLCSDQEPVQPDSMIRRIHILHGMYLGILSVGLFILGKSTGMPSRWAFFSCLLSFLFFGTNRFSYFTYYSLAPTFSSLLLCWLWTALFFFRRDSVALIIGFLSVLLLIPILWVNHTQEVFLLGFIAVCWLLLNLHERIWQIFAKEKQKGQADPMNGVRIVVKDRSKSGFPVLTIFRSLYLFCIVGIFFILPQFEAVQNFIASFSSRNLWEQNQHIIFHWLDLEFFGRVWGFGVEETFLSPGLLVVLLALPFFFPGWIRKKNAIKVRIFLLAVLPFIGYFTPLFHLFWLSLVGDYVYYRLCYSTMFWLFFAYMFWGLEGRFVLVIKKIRRRLMG